MDLSSLLEWVQAHWDDIVFIYTSIVGIASVIVKLVPTLSSNNPFLPIVKVIGKYIALNRESPTKRPQ